MRFARSPRLAAAATVVLILGSAATVRAESRAWDQAAVTTLAKQLVDATTAWELAAREQGAGSIGAADEQDSLPNKARTLREMSDGLVGHLEKGDGRDKTLDQYRSMREIEDDTILAVERSEMQKPANEAWAKVTGLLAQLAPYYGMKPADVR